MDSDICRPTPPTNKYVLMRMELQLLKKLRHGLNLVGFPTGRRRNSLPLLPVEPLGGVCLSHYTSDSRWWRIKYGQVCFQGQGYYRYPVILEPREHTLHIDEFSEHIGLELGHLIREPDWLWPLFTNYKSYPQYAWSEKAWSSYQAECEIRENWRKRCLERRASR